MSQDTVAHIYDLSQFLDELSVFDLPIRDQIAYERYIAYWINKETLIDTGHYTIESVMYDQASKLNKFLSRNIKLPETVYEIGSELDLLKVVLNRPLKKFDLMIKITKREVW